ncbi:MAG: hypothetical protein ACYC7L_05525 [Nitrospirota bacterium]
MELDRSLSSNKKNLLGYFRDRGSEFLTEIRHTYGSTQYKEQASAINKALVEAKDNLISALLQKAEAEKWTNKDKLECILMITYCNYIVMLEYRNDVWPYEYMTFSRRIGELWEPFCKLCFQFPLNKISLFVPPLFSEVKAKLADEIRDYIDSLSITKKQKVQLKNYYDKVWGLVTSGEIKLELDLHFMLDKEKFVVDFKSGFGSNEKGNTNRLLLVASIFKNLEENYRCLIFVRSDDNNNYFQTLKKSGIWEAYSGGQAYKKMKEYSGYDIKKWIDNNIKWDQDFKRETMAFFRKHRLDQYLVW